MIMIIKSVLIIDDNNSTRMLLKYTLQLIGLETVEAVDGLDGWCTFQRLKGENSTPALIIADLAMPNMDGFEFIMKVRESDESIPILFISAQGRPDLLEQARAAGASGWIVKPFARETIQEIVKNLLGLG